MEVTREHGLLDVSLPRHVKESEFLHFRELFFAQVTLLWFCHLSKKGSREMGHEIIDHCQGLKDVLVFGITRQTRVNSELFNTFIIKKKKISYHINNVSKKKKDLNTYLRPVSLSNSIWYAKNCRAIRPNNKLSYRINVLRIILIRIPLVLLISSM